MTNEARQIRHRVLLRQVPPAYVDETKTPPVVQILYVSEMEESAAEPAIVLQLPIDVFESMGEPPVMTLTIEPGDLLNPEMADVVGGSISKTSANDARARRGGGPWG